MKLFLNFPLVYDAFTSLIMKRASMKMLVDRHIRPSAGSRLLDVGSGTSTLLLYLEYVDYVGIDFNPRHIQSARERHRSRGRFICADVSQLGVGGEMGSFDVVTGIGLLHHLDDDAVMQLLKTVHGLLRPGGRFVTFDGCYQEGQSAVARWILDNDRGKHIRTVDGYVELVKKVFPLYSHTHYSGLLRIPYDHIIMECTR